MNTNIDSCTLDWYLYPCTLVAFPSKKKEISEEQYWFLLVAGTELP